MRFAGRPRFRQCAKARLFSLQKRLCVNAGASALQRSGFFVERGFILGAGEGIYIQKAAIALRCNRPPKGETGAWTMKFWRKLRGEKEDFDAWEYPYESEEKEYREIKKAAIAVLLFGVVYALQGLDTELGRFVSAQVRALVTAQTDFSYWAEAARQRFPVRLDDAFFQRVRQVVARPADPRNYMRMPVEGKALAAFDAEKSEGVFYACAPNALVRAAAAGRVAGVQTQANGVTVRLDHGGDIETLYGGLSESFVTEGEAVSQGQALGKSGKEARQKESGISFALRERGVPVDPATRLQPETAREGGQP